MDLTRSALTHITKISSTQTGVFSSRNQTQNPYLMKDVRGNDVDLSWLL